MARRPRNHVDLPLAAGRHLTLPEKVAHHLRQVLRLKAGDEILLFNGRDGREWTARLEEVDRRRVVALVLADRPALPPPALPLHLALGISKGDRMDHALQKAVELGVASVTPLFCRRSVVRLSGERLARKLHHWQGVIIGACEQSGRGDLPPLNPPMPLDAWLAQGPPAPTLLLDPQASITLPELPPPKGLTFLVGPEGGLSDDERHLALAAGCTAIRLGPRILRTETAPLAALAAAQALWGDFRHAG